MMTDDSRLESSREEDWKRKNNSSRQSDTEYSKGRAPSTKFSEVGSFDQPIPIEEMSANLDVLDRRDRGSNRESLKGTRSMYLSMQSYTALFNKPRHIGRPQHYERDVLSRRLHPVCEERVR